MSKMSAELAAVKEFRRLYNVIGFRDPAECAEALDLVLDFEVAAWLDHDSYVGEMPAWVLIRMHELAGNGAPFVFGEGK